MHANSKGGHLRVKYDKGVKHDEKSGLPRSRHLSRPSSRESSSSELVDSEDEEEA